MLTKRLLPLLLSVSAHGFAADWPLTGLIYHGYCPPAALGQGLCKQNQDWDASLYIVRPQVFGSLLVNQLGQDEGGLKFGSRIVIQKPTALHPKQKFSYVLGEVFPGNDLWDLGNDLAGLDMLSKLVPMEIEHDLCSISIRGEFAEANYATQPPARRDVTMTFRNANCSD